MVDDEALRGKAICADWPLPLSEAGWGICHYHVVNMVNCVGQGEQEGRRRRNHSHRYWDPENHVE